MSSCAQTNVWICKRACALVFATHAAVYTVLAGFGS